MFENTEKTDIEKLGEFGLINHLTKNIKLGQKSTVKGVGDDAAVLDFKGKKVLISTDILLEGIHFDLAYTPLKHLGYKSVQVNLSDIYAMNGTATQVTVSIGISSRFPLEAVEELYEGIYLACEKYNIDLVGGDTSSSKQGLVISITSIGYADEKDVVYRNGAEEGDLICVSGDLGGAYTGLQLLEREKILNAFFGRRPAPGGKGRCGGFHCSRDIFNSGQGHSGQSLRCCRIEDFDGIG